MQLRLKNARSASQSVEARRCSSLISQSRKASFPSISLPRQSPQSHVAPLSLSLLRLVFSEFELYKSGHRYSKEALELSAKLLEANPECHTAWNYRKLAVQHFLSPLSDSDPQSVASIFDEELRVVRF